MGASMCASSAHRDPAYVRSRGVPSVQSLSVPTNIRPVPSTRPSAGQRARADVACGPCERTRTARSTARIARRSSGRLEMLLDRPRTARAGHLKRPLNLPIPAPKHVRDAKTTLETAAKRLLEPTKRARCDRPGARQRACVRYRAVAAPPTKRLTGLTPDT